MRAAVRRAPRSSTPAARRVYAPGEQPTFSQAQQRERRRGWLRVHYREQFDLRAEVSAIVDPLAQQVCALPRPLAMRRDVDNIVDAVHELVSTVVGMLAESSHLSGAAYARTRRAVADLAQRPHEPQITDDQLADGSWAPLLAEHVAPHSDDLAAFLGRALPPQHPQLGTLDSASERLEAALRVLDTAALDLARRVPRIARAQALPSIESVNAATRARHEAERTRKRLAKMGATP